MAKKKISRIKHQKEFSVIDTSEEESKETTFKGKICQHIQRGLNFARVKRNLKSVNITTCSGCSETDNDDDLLEVWICLQCGNTGCGRMSTNKHAFQHFKKLHSDCHSLTLSSLSGIVWCYDCDDEVQLQQSRNLRQAVDFILKMKGSENKSGLKNHPSNQPNHVETGLREQITSVNTEVKSTNMRLVNKNKKDNHSAKLFIKGLRNLGNTCFFNAVMQNLNQTNLLHDILEKVCATDYVWEVPQLIYVDGVIVDDTSSESLKIPIPRQFPLAMSLLNFYKQMNCSSSIKNEVVNPNQLFSEISKKAPHLNHFQEQDSHELLRQLLDGVRQDEVKRQKKAILRHFDISNVPLEDVDDETKKLIKGYGCYASHTIVEKIFGGLFISTVLCEECKMSSQVFEPFMDMSLPLFEEKQQDNCNQPYLEGGQQQDFKPLRNRKVNQDENNEYMLTKPKKETGKPSKYQERKMKQLARKEKKKKNNKVRKVSESNDPLSAAEEDSLNENISVECENEDSQIIDNDNNIDKLQFEEDGKILNSGDINDELQSQAKNKMIHLQDTDDVQQCQAESKTTNFDVDGSLETITPVSDQAQEIKHQNSKTVPIENTQLVNGNCSETQQRSSKLMNEPNENSLDHTAIESDSKEFESTVNKLSCLSDPKENDSLSNCNGESNLSHNVGLNEESEFKIGPNSPEMITADLLMESLAKDIKELYVSSTTNALDPDEKMQLLGMQVKEVRIRCDSDRQGSILDSSLSPDDEANLASCDSREETNENASDENWSRAFTESQTKEWISKSLLTLKPRKHIPPNECSIDSCLTYFTKPELLTGSNKFRCEKCTEIKVQKTGNKKDVAYSNASKQLLIFSPPAILTLHLKRFQQVGMSLRKVNRFVEFPEILDLAPYCSSACQILPHVSSEGNEIMYSLYGVVEHSGRMSSGHYTAYVKVTKRTLNENFMCHLPLAQCDFEQLLQKFSKTELKNPSGCVRNSEEYRWYYVSDSHVREADVSQVLKCQAYLLFYERIK